MLRAKEFNILIDDVAITHLSFGTEVWPMHLTSRAEMSPCHGNDPCHSADAW